MIKNLLDKITGTYVLAAGVAGSVISAALVLSPVTAVSVAVLASLAEIFRIPFIEKLMARLLGGFADAPEWPSFVALGIALCIVIVHGGWSGLLVGVFLLVAMDGNVFEALY